jgi:hypothetical protein
MKFIRGFRKFKLIKESLGETKSFFEKNKEVILSYYKFIFDNCGNATAIEEPDRRVAPVMITLKDGSQGFQREDGKFDVFQFSSNGKFSGMKTVTGQLQVANVKREDTSASTEGSSATEKHLKTLMKTHQCSRAEALKKIKCYKCQKSGQFAKDCNVDAEDGEPPSFCGTPFLRCGHKRRQ